MNGIKIKKTVVERKISSPDFEKWKRILLFHKQAVTPVLRLIINGRWANRPRQRKQIKHGTSVIIITIKIDREYFGKYFKSRALSRNEIA